MCGCNSGKQQKWLGIWWHGVPFPKRWLHPLTEFKGCGCPRVTRQMWAAAKAGVFTWRAARKSSRLQDEHNKSKEQADASQRTTAEEGT